jgi:hypothetical protein
VLQELEQGEEELQSSLAAANSKLRARALEEEQQRELCAQVLSLLALLVQKVPSLLSCVTGTKGTDVQLRAQQERELAAVARVLQAASARTRNATATATATATAGAHTAARISM